MPDRIVRVGILSSEPVNGLSWAAEVLYRRLLSVVDDFGRYDARSTMLRAHLYPLKIDRVSDADVGKWLTECVTAGLVSIYQVSGQPYLSVAKFGQRVRAEKSKWPDPPSSADICPQPHADAAVFVSAVVSVDEKGARKRSPSFDASKVELPAWLDAELWGDWVKDRAERGKRITERGAREQLATLDEFRKIGHSPERTIRHAISSGNQGLFPPPKLNGADIARSTVPSRPPDPNSALAQLERERLEREARTPEEKAAADIVRRQVMASIKTIGKAA